eukprot:2345397-Prorocentrum_lima.AAC.1
MLPNNSREVPSTIAPACEAVALDWLDLLQDLCEACPVILCGLLQGAREKGEVRAFGTAPMPPFVRAEDAVGETL